MTPEHTPEQIQAIFRRRAIQLAQKPAANRLDGAGTPALIFRLNAERYAVALCDLAEILSFEPCTPVPGSRPEFRGVINLRGEIRPVVDLAQLISGAAPSDSSPNNTDVNDSRLTAGAVLILRRGIALKVDAVEELSEIHSDEMTRAVHSQYVRAVLPGAVALLDVEAIFPAVSSAKESPFL